MLGVVFITLFGYATAQTNIPVQTPLQQTFVPVAPVIPGRTVFPTTQVLNRPVLQRFQPLVPQQVPVPTSSNFLQDTPVGTPVGNVVPVQPIVQQVAPVSSFRNLVPSQQFIAVPQQPLQPAVNNAPASSFRTYLLDDGSTPVASTNLRPAINVVHRIHQADDQGQFHSNYVDSAGTTVQESGVLEPTNDGTDYVLTKKGSFSFNTPEGKSVKVNYEADKLGFRPVSDAIPVPVQPLH